MKPLCPRSHKCSRCGSKRQQFLKNNRSLSEFTLLDLTARQFLFFFFFQDEDLRSFPPRSSFSRQVRLLQVSVELTSEGVSVKDRGRHDDRIWHNSRIPRKYPYCYIMKWNLTGTACEPLLSFPTFTLCGAGLTTGAPSNFQGGSVKKWKNITLLWFGWRDSSEIQ